MKYWAAHCRGCDYDHLRSLGFLVLHPHIDDYVFLEVCEKNTKFLRQENKLNILFVRFEDNVMEIDESEMSFMRRETVDSITDGSDILVVKGIYANLEGVIIEDQGDIYKCEIYGYKRKYYPNIKSNYVVRKK